MNHLTLWISMYPFVGIFVAACPLLDDWYKKYKTKDAENALRVLVWLLWPLMVLWAVIGLLRVVAWLISQIKSPFVAFGRGIADVWHYHSLKRAGKRIANYHKELDAIAAELPKAKVVRGG